MDQFKHLTRKPNPRKYTMKKIIFSIFILISLSGCSSTKHHDVTVKTQVNKLETPTENLANFQKFELTTLKLSNQVAKHEEKVEVAKTIEDKLQKKLSPLLKSWNETDVRGKHGTLIIEPEITVLHVVSSMGRLWFGASAGHSRIDLTLTISEKESGDIIAQPTLMLDSGGFAGVFSSADKTLLDYVADISYQYLKNNYK